MPHTSFMDDFKTVYNEKGKHDLKAQIPFLSKLADRYKKKGKKDPRKHWSDLLKAHALYNSCAVREDDKDLKERWETACYKVQKMYWGQQVQTTQEQVLKVAADIREKLELLRTVMRRKLEPITKEIESWQSSFQYLKDSTDNPKIPFDLCQQIKTISLYCNNVMVGIAKAVIGESINFCGNPPCEFSAVAFGSLAKGEATPYSDLEYLFLIAEQKDVSIKYFELLAVTSYFIIGNVQETKLKYMNVDELQSGKWFEDEAKCGFKIDGLSVKAGNIPTGNNMPGTPRNYLIVTPGQLLQRYTEMLDNPEQNLEQPGDLTDMLSYMKEFYNHGRSKSLYSDFCKSISTIKPNPLRKDASLEMLQQDIRSYDFIPGDPLKFQTRSHSLNLKTDIYRYPSIIIYDLKIVFGMKQPEDSWETLLLMRTVGALSESLYGCLLFLLCSAQYIRFAAYLHYNSQQDKISVLLERANRVRRPSGSGSWHLPRGLLYRICLLLTSTKLHIQLGMLKEPMDFQRYISAIGFYKIIEEPENIIECVHHQYPNLQGLDIFTMYELAQAHTKLFDFENGAMFFDILEVTVLHSLFELDTQLFFKKFRGMQRTLFSLNLSLANVLICSGKTEYAKEILQRVSSYDMDQKERQDFECLKVDLLHSTGETTRAIEHLEYVASESEHEDNCSIGEDNLEQEYRFRMKRAILMKDAGSLKKAGKQLDAALKLVQNIYGLESRHPDIANVFEHLAEVEIALKNYDKAENYLAEAEQVFTADEQVHRHQFLRIELYMGRKDFKQALAYVLKLVNVIEKPAKKVKIPSHQQGKVYMLMGLIFLNLGKTVTAEHKLKQAISFYLIPIPDSNQNIIVPELEQTMYILADCCLQNLKPLEALHCIRNCLGGLNELISRKPDINPGYLHYIDGTLSAVIKALWREAELSTESDDHKADIRHCFILLSSIYTMKKNDGRAIKFMAEADKY